ncbi:MAG: hypothetical protein JNL09_07480 [Anaerolineales bacterium]|nr:hypothetical protein [Anaerolineales bacterium]
MRIPIWFTLVIAVAITALALAAAWILLNPSGPPLANAAVSLEAISPNADRKDESTRFTYVLRRPATVSIYFINAAGERFYFRREKPRPAGENTVDFGGVVEPYLLPGEQYSAEVLARVLQDGAYTWTVEATDDAGQNNALTGTLTVQGADTTLPLLTNLTVGPKLFTPNQDGLDDRVTFNVDLTKTVPANNLRLYLIGPNSVEFTIGESANTPREPGEAGVHEYDYDGGVEFSEIPPPDGEYTVRAEAEDALGQKTRLATQLSIQGGGLPQAEIVQGQVDFSSNVVVVGDTLYFTITVQNYGQSPIRTTGPFAGHVYESMSQNYAATGFFQESGAFRIGLMCDTCMNDFPWRWALGTPENLTTLQDANGRPHLYLMPGQRATITGGIVLDEIITRRNPQYFWAGLIHEDVRILNNRTDQQLITIEAK